MEFVVSGNNLSLSTVLNEDNNFYNFSKYCKLKERIESLKKEIRILGITKLSHDNINMSLNNIFKGTTIEKRSIKSKQNLEWVQK